MVQPIRRGRQGVVDASCQLKHQVAVREGRVEPSAGEGEWFWGALGLPPLATSDQKGASKPALAWGCAVAPEQLRGQRGGGPTRMRAAAEVLVPIMCHEAEGCIAAVVEAGLAAEGVETKSCVAAELRAGAAWGLYYDREW